MKAKYPHVKDHYQLEEIDGELLLYSPETTRSIYMNSTASIIWRLCDGRHSVADIIDLLTEAFPEASDSMEPDVTQSIEMFVKNKAMSLEEQPKQSS